MSEERRHLAKMFHKKFSRIPSNKWCCHKLHNDQGQSCALGHTMPFDQFQESEETKQLCSVFSSSHLFDGWGRIARINNYTSEQYPQPTPKARILAALEDIIRH